MSKMDKDDVDWEHAAHINGTHTVYKAERKVIEAAKACVKYAYPCRRKDYYSLDVAVEALKEARK